MATPERNGVFEKVVAVLSVVALLSVWIKRDNDAYAQDQAMIQDRLNRVEAHITSDGHPEQVLTKIEELRRQVQEHVKLNSHPAADAQHKQFSQQLTEIETQFREERSIRYSDDARIRELLKLPSHEYLPKDGKR